MCEKLSSNSTHDYVIVFVETSSLLQVISLDNYSYVLSYFSFVSVSINHVETEQTCIYLILSSKFHKSLSIRILITQNNRFCNIFHQTTGIKTFGYT